MFGPSLLLNAVAIYSKRQAIERAIEPCIGRPTPFIATPKLQIDLLKVVKNYTVSQENCTTILFLQQFRYTKLYFNNFWHTGLYLNKFATKRQAYQYLLEDIGIMFVKCSIHKSTSATSYKIEHHHYCHERLNKTS